MGEHEIVSRCEPAPEDRHHRWHWLRRADVARPAEYCRYRNSEPLWAVGQYMDSGTASWMYECGWRYVGPAVPPDGG
jgi:hypothetical protein